MNTRLIQCTCHACGKVFDLLQREAVGSWWPTGGLCDACDDEAIRVANLRRDRDGVPFWRKRWLSLTPVEFQVPIERARLPDAAAFDRALRWTEKNERASLLLVGDTGLGKTRALYALLAQILTRRPAITIERYNCITFGETAREKSYQGKGAEWFERLRTVDFVVFDDLFRGVLIDQIQEELFGLVSVRTENRLPILATTQFTADTLEKSGVLKGHHAAAITRRLREYFEVVKFKKPPTKETP
jgi:DNA replication protein DnaC